MPIATEDPTRMPKVKNTPIKVATCSLLSSLAFEGALIANCVPAKPLLTPNKIILSTLNQSASYPNNHYGSDSYETRIKVAMNMTLE